MPSSVSRTWKHSCVCFVLWKLHLDLEHSAPVFGFTVCDGAVEADPGIGNQDIHGAEALDGAGDQRLAGYRVGYVGRDGECSSAQLIRKALQPVFAAGCEDDVVAVLGEQARRASPMPLEAPVTMAVLPLRTLPSVLPVVRGG